MRDGMIGLTILWAALIGTFTICALLADGWRI